MVQPNQNSTRTLPQELAHLNNIGGLHIGVMAAAAYADAAYLDRYVQQSLRMPVANKLHVIGAVPGSTCAVGPLPVDNLNTYSPGSISSSERGAAVVRHGAAFSLVVGSGKLPLDADVMEPREIDTDYGRIGTLSPATLLAFASTFPQIPQSSVRHLIQVGIITAEDRRLVREGEQYEAFRNVRKILQPTPGWRAKLGGLGNCALAKRFEIKPWIPNR